MSCLNLKLSLIIFHSKEEKEESHEEQSSVTDTIVGICKFI